MAARRLDDALFRKQSPLFMNAYEKITLQRDVVGTLIPAGTKVELPEGAEARITQALGGSYTVEVQGHLFRLEGRDADAIGRAPVEVPQLAVDASADDVEKAVWTQLATCYDPEIPINIVELGLIYGCELESHAEGGWNVRIRMTLTAPGCGMGDVLVADVRSKSLEVPGVRETEVELVFDPPWTRDMMSEAAQLQAGFI
jgi:probable FeS assembly SUF system protein SufT